MKIVTFAEENAKMMYSYDKKVNKNDFIPRK